MNGHDLQPGTQIDGFTILSPLQATVGPVYRAVQRDPRREVALRLVALDENAASNAERFLARVHAVAALEHPSILPIFAAGRSGDWLYIATRLNDDGDLGTRLEATGRMSLAETVTLLGPIADALDYAHQEGVGHGAIRPSSVRLDRRGGPYLADFESAALTGEDDPASAPMEGLRYVAPEQLAGTPDRSPHSGDIYSLACVAFECLSGAPAFLSDERLAVIAAKLRTDAPSIRETRPEVSPGVDDTFRRALAASPSERFATAGEFIASLAADAAIAAQPVAAAPVLETPPPVDGAAKLGAPSPAAPTRPRPPAASPASGPVQPETRPYLDEDAQFTVYRPRSVVPATWYTMLAFAHLSARPIDARDDDPDPIEEVRRQAEQILGAQMTAYGVLTQDSAVGIPRDGEISFVPSVPGVEFNPPSRQFLWQESVHREEFRLRAAAELDGSTVHGTLGVFLGSILLADVRLTIKVDRVVVPGPVATSESARRYRSIFASYSHLDREIVRQCRAYAETLGDRLMQDTIELRSGEEWDPRLLELIDQADIFQLFWSTNSMRSKAVRREWEYALGLGRQNFVRPVYWETPMPKDRDLGLPPDVLRRFHFQQLPLPVGVVAGATSPRPTAGGPTDQVPPDAPPPPAAPSPVLPPSAPVGWDRTDQRLEMPDAWSRTDARRGRVPAPGSGAWRRGAGLVARSVFLVIALGLLMVLAFSVFMFAGSQGP